MYEVYAYLLIVFVILCAMKKLLTYDNIRVVKTLGVMLVITAVYIAIIKKNPRIGTILFIAGLVIYVISLLLLKLRKKYNA